MFIAVQTNPSSPLFLGKLTSSSKLFFLSIYRSLTPSSQSLNTVVIRKVDQINDRIRVFRLEVPREGPAIRVCMCVFAVPRRNARLADPDPDPDGPAAPGTSTD